MISPQLYMSARFRKAYENASLLLKRKAEERVHDLVRQFRSDPRAILRRYDTIAGLKISVKEADLGASDRMLFDITNDSILLLHMGNHAIVGQYTSWMAQQDTASYDQAWSYFWPERSGFFKRIPNRTYKLLHESELGTEWLYYLSEEQASVNQDISNRLFNVLDSSSYSPPYFIIGGPGTGKTCILLNLLRLLGDIDEELVTRIVMSKELANYIEKSTGANIKRYRTGKQGAKNSDLLLVDDPNSKYDIQHYLEEYKANEIRAVVIAFDPLQLKKSLPDAEFQQLVETYDVTVYKLQTCYRQKEHVGTVTKQVIDMIAESSPYLAERKKARHREEHKTLTTLANEIRFVNPAGYVQYYECTTISDIQSEIERILDNQWAMWRHHPGLLVVEGLSRGYHLSDAANYALQPLEKQGYIQRVSLDSLEQVKGLEFQHVFIFLNYDLFQEIQQGFSGTGRNIYEDRRLLRIPFSRAKDGIVTFVVTHAAI